MSDEPAAFEGGTSTKLNPRAQVFQPGGGFTQADTTTVHHSHHHHQQQQHSLASLAGMHPSVGVGHQAHHHQQQHNAFPGFGAHAASAGTPTTAAVRVGGLPPPSVVGQQPSPSIPPSAGFQPPTLVGHGGQVQVTPQQMAAVFASGGAAGPSLRPQVAVPSASHVVMQSPAANLTTTTVGAPPPAVAMGVPPGGGGGGDGSNFVLHSAPPPPKTRRGARGQGHERRKEETRQQLQGHQLPPHLLQIGLYGGLEAALSTRVTDAVLTPSAVFPRAPEVDPMLAQAMFDALAQQQRSVFSPSVITMSSFQTANALLKASQSLASGFPSAVASVAASQLRHAERTLCARQPLPSAAVAVSKIEETALRREAALPAFDNRLFNAFRSAVDSGALSLNCFGIGEGQAVIASTIRAVQHIMAPTAATATTTSAGGGGGEPHSSSQEASDADAASPNSPTDQQQQPRPSTTAIPETVAPFWSAYSLSIVNRAASCIAQASRKEDGVSSDPSPPTEATDDPSKPRKQPQNIRHAYTPSRQQLARIAGNVIASLQAEDPQLCDFLLSASPSDNGEDEITASEWDEAARYLMLSLYVVGRAEALQPQEYHLRSPLPSEEATKIVLQQGSTRTAHTNTTEGENASSIGGSASSAHRLNQSAKTARTDASGGLGVSDNTKARSSLNTSTAATQIGGDEEDSLSSSGENVLVDNTEERDDPNQVRYLLLDEPLETTKPNPSEQQLQPLPDDEELNSGPHSECFESNDASAEAMNKLKKDNDEGDAAATTPPVEPGVESQFAPPNEIAAWHQRCVGDTLLAPPTAGATTTGPKDGHDEKWFPADEARGLLLRQTLYSANAKPFIKCCLAMLVLAEAYVPFISTVEARLESLRAEPEFLRKLAHALSIKQRHQSWVIKTFEDSKTGRAQAPLVVDPTDCGDSPQPMTLAAAGRRVAALLHCVRIKRALSEGLHRFVPGLLRAPSQNCTAAAALAALRALPAHAFPTEDLNVCASVVIEVLTADGEIERSRREQKENQEEGAAMTTLPLWRLLSLPSGPPSVTAMEQQKQQRSNAALGDAGPNAQPSSPEPAASILNTVGGAQTAAQIIQQGSERDRGSVAERIIANAVVPTSGGLPPAAPTAFDRTTALGTTPPPVFHQQPHSQKPQSATVKAPPPPLPTAAAAASSSSNPPPLVTVNPALDDVPLPNPTLWMEQQSLMSSNIADRAKLLSFVMVALAESDSVALSTVKRCTSALESACDNDYDPLTEQVLRKKQPPRPILDLTDLAGRLIDAPNEGAIHRRIVRKAVEAVSQREILPTLQRQSHTASAPSQPQSEQPWQIAKAVAAANQQQQAPVSVQIGGQRGGDSNSAAQQHRPRNTGGPSARPLPPSSSSAAGTTTTTTSFHHAASGGGGAGGLTPPHHYPGAPSHGTGGSDAGGSSGERRSSRSPPTNYSDPPPQPPAFHTSDYHHLHHPSASSGGGSSRQTTPILQHSSAAISSQQRLVFGSNVVLSSAMRSSGGGGGGSKEPPSPLLSMAPQFSAAARNHRDGEPDNNHHHHHHRGYDDDDDDDAADESHIAELLSSAMQQHHYSQQPTENKTNEKSPQFEIDGVWAGSGGAGSGGWGATTAAQELQAPPPSSPGATTTTTTTAPNTDPTASLVALTEALKQQQEPSNAESQDTGGSRPPGWNMAWGGGGNDATW